MGEKSMNLNEYQNECLRTLPELNERDIVINGVLGMNGESGEVADELKKYLFHGHDYNEDKFVEEIGDVLWYIATTLSGLGVTMEECAKRNIDKLKKRYPIGFDANRSKSRYIN